MEIEEIIYFDELIYLVERDLYDVNILILVAIKYNNLDVIQYCCNKELNNKKDIEIYAGKYSNFYNLIWLLENLALDIDNICLGAAENNRLDVILYFDEVFVLNLQEILSRAATFGKLDIIKHFADEDEIDISFILLDAAEAGKLNVIKWYFDVNKEIFEFDNIIDEILEIASKNGHLHIINFIDKIYNIQNFDEILQNAAYNNHNDIVRKYIHKIEDIKELALNCCYNDNLIAFIMCSNLGFRNPSQLKEVISLCEQYGSIKILKYIENYL